MCGALVSFFLLKYVHGPNLYLISDKKKGGKGGGFATISATHKVYLYIYMLN